MGTQREQSVSGARSGFDWYKQIARIIGSTDRPNLPDTLVGAIRSVVDFEHSVIFGYPERRRPVFLFDGFGSAYKKSCVAPYLNGSYLVDPFYHACASGIAPGVYRMHDLAPDQFHAQVGGHPGYISPCISEEPGYLSEEIGFFARTESGVYIVLSLMRPHDSPPFSSAEFAWLVRVEPVVSAVMAYHWRDLGSNEAATFPAACLSNLVETAFQSFGNPLLTAREQEVARLILRGHSTESVARTLDISKATVKIHRRNAYAKLNISSQSELFSLFIEALPSHAASD
jgi:DNA-binding CsgD family transcriptional regulator